MTDPSPTDLVTLVATLSAAKVAEQQAKAARVAAEDALIQFTGFDLPEGQKTFEHTRDDGASAKVTLKQPITTSVNSDGWLALRKKLDPKHPARGIFVQSFKLGTKEARALQDTNPTAWADVSDVIDRKPGKVSVEIKHVIGPQQPPQGVPLGGEG
jgi:hypothetical protein